jgi:hypothetical protein
VEEQGLILPNSTTAIKVEVNPILDALRLLVAPGTVVELRALHVEKGPGFARTLAGFFDFDHLEKLAQEAARLSPMSAGVYWTLNPLNCDLLARCSNRVKVADSGMLASDKDVLHRRWLLIDADPVRLAGVSATEAEKRAAWEAIQEVREDLRGSCWSDPILADSGNGYHLLYRIDLPSDDREVVKRILKALAQRYDNDKVKIDTAVFNPARICKLYGTLSRKGDSTRDRPHRLAQILESPDPLRAVAVKNLETLAEEYQEQKPEAKPQVHGSVPENVQQFSRLLVDQWLRDRGIAYKLKPSPDSMGRTVYLLNECPFDPAHGRSKEVAIFQEPGGKLAARCMHNSCQGKTWQDFKKAIGNPGPDHYDPPLKGHKKLQFDDVAKRDDDDDPRPLIRISTDEHLVNEEAAKALAADPTIFYRSGVGLVHVVRDVERPKDIIRPPGSPRIVPLPAARLRERLAANARFVGFTKNRKALELKHPPDYCVAGVAARGQWEGIRELVAVVNAPILRPNGTVLCTAGYDGSTGLLFEPNCDFPIISEKPSLTDLEQALTVLLDLVADFPFAKLAHRAAWLAAMLTPLARYAFSGPAPLFLMDSNVRGSGKSLLCDIIALTVTGRDMPRMGNPDTDDEWRKRITSLALGGDQLVLIDNISFGLGSASIDAALTSTIWKDRILGRSEIVELPLNATWFATGNNVCLRADTSRRAAHVRLESQVENPEERSGFRHQDLKKYVLRERPNLLAAALTILRGYCAAGRPNQQLTPWGSFEGWSDLVRSTVVWAGQPDPGETRQELRKESDTEAGALPALFAGLEHLDPEGRGLTVSEIVAYVESAENNQAAGPVRGLKEALILLCPSGRKDFPSAKSIGMKFHHLRGRVVCGRCLRRAEDRNTALWSVQRI